MAEKNPSIYRRVPTIVVCITERTLATASAQTTDLQGVCKARALTVLPPWFLRNGL